MDKSLWGAGSAAANRARTSRRRANGAALCKPFSHKVLRVIKMANGHGGYRQGSGRKKKPLHEKLTEGNPGKRPNKVLGFAEGLPAEIEPPEYMYEFGAFEIEPDMDGFYKSTAKWLQRTGCLHLINPDFIAEYAMLKTRWLECELMVKSLMLVQDANGVWMAKDVADVGLRYLKQADMVWGKIWNIVSQNCEYSFGSENPNADIMAVLLTAKLE